MNLLSAEASAVPVAFVQQIAETSRSWWKLNFLTIRSGAGRKAADKIVVGISEDFPFLRFHTVAQKKQQFCHTGLPDEDQAESTSGQNQRGYKTVAAFAATSISTIYARGERRMTCAPAPALFATGRGMLVDNANGAAC